MINVVVRCGGGQHARTAKSEARPAAFGRSEERRKQGERGAKEREDAKGGRFGTWKAGEKWAAQMVSAGAIPPASAEGRPPRTQIQRRGGAGLRMKQGRAAPAATDER